MAHGAVSRWLGSYWPEDGTAAGSGDLEDRICAVCGLFLLPGELATEATVCGPCQAGTVDPDQETLAF